MTYEATSCPCCGRSDLETRAALIAPFIARYLHDQPPSRCQLSLCRSCDAMFFNKRFTPDEVAKLYHDYRGSAYFAARHNWEPWYTRAFNDRIGGDKEIEIRKSIYRRAVAPWLSGAVETVLDYAGDSGQLMPGGPGRRHLVHDISGVEPVDGVELMDEEMLCGQEFDLVLLCHVIEHFSEPLQETGGVVQYVKRGGLLYVEAPFERFPITDIPNNTLYQSYINVLTKSDVLTILMDFWSTAIRVKFHRIPPLGFAKLHEHLNYFNEGSLRRLLEHAGLEVLACSVADEMEVVTAVCRRPATDAEHR